MSEDVSTILASHAAELSRAIFSLLNKGRLKPSDLHSYRAAYDIATSLYLINTYLDSLPPYWIGFDIEQLSRAILQDLQAITQPTKRSTDGPTPFQSLFYITSPFKRSDPTDQETCLVVFFRAQTENSRNLKDACNNLLDKLTTDEDHAKGLPDSATQHLDDMDTSAGLDDGIFDALQLTTECHPASHDTTTDTVLANEGDSRMLRHPARLCLHETEDGHGSVVRNLGIFVSAMDMALWQEFCLMNQLGVPAEDAQQLHGQGGFCSIIERDVTARLFLSFNHDKGLLLHRKGGILSRILQAGRGESLADVLRSYDLKPKDKVMLSYTIARSYWKYYDSQLMRTKWTSEAIFFMPEKDGREGEGQLPLCAYVSFPFDAPNNTLPDIMYEDLLNHRCPRIFDIGVLLLEIGLAKPFRTGNRRDAVAQANLNHKIATDELLKLEMTNWDGFTNNKKYFDQVIKFCLNSENFTPASKQPSTTRQGMVLSTGPATASGQQSDISMRRKIFHKNVVRPLAWLAKKGFRAQTGDITYVNKKPGPLPERGVSDTPQLPEPEVLFHSAIDDKMWLVNLGKISEQVERKRREHRVRTAVRVAILDTGLNRDFPIFKAKNGLIKSIKEEADFVNPDAETMIDTFGHGTFMARLLMECAPSVDILVARVATNTDELGRSQKNIQDAIIWAGRAGKADIITMSFGFPTDDVGIREAIETVQRERDDAVIFLASAGNSSTDDESFPARHPSVISVHATNCYGGFLQSNSASASKGADVLGTYGDDIPNTIRDEFSTAYPQICQPGSSVATAVMAGISATMLAYAPVLPLLVPLQGVAASTSAHVLRHLWTSKGMEAVLSRLAPENSDHRRLKAVKPMWFWKSRPEDSKRYFAICDILAEVERKSPRLAGTV